MIGVHGVTGDADDDAYYAEEHVDERPPGKVREADLDVSNDGADEGDEPAAL